jgi:hypothetical protein
LFVRVSDIQLIINLLVGLGMAELGLVDYFLMGEAIGIAATLFVSFCAECKIIFYTRMCMYGRCRQTYTNVYAIIFDVFQVFHCWAGQQISRNLALSLPEPNKASRSARAIGSACELPSPACTTTSTASKTGSETSFTIAAKLNLLADTLIKCAVCTQKVSNQNKYCLYHKQAYDNLIKHYKIWNKAFDGLSWTNYMNKLLELKETGSWVKEVISAELKTASS